MSDFIPALKASLDAEAIFAESIRDYDPAQKLQRCPFHGDEKPSLSLELEQGLYKCFACPAKGDIITWWAELNKVSTWEAVQQLARRAGMPIPDKRVVPPELVSSAEEALWKNPKCLEYLTLTRGLKPDILRSRRVGWNGRRYVIPVFDQFGDCVNLRLYSPKARNKMLNHTDSEGSHYGQARLWPHDSLEADDILICEGEWDTMLALQAGFKAVTSTHGAGTWLVSWNRLFQGKTVRICYDHDAAGERGAQTVASNLHRFAQAIYVVKLPVAQKGEDITDYFMKYHHSADDFRRVVHDTPPWVSAGGDSEEQEEVSDVALSDASNGENFGKLLRFKGKVSGLDIAPYVVPRKFRISCNMQAGKMCANCPVQKDDGAMDTEVRLDDPVLLRFAGVTDVQLDTAMCRHAGVPKGCKYAVPEMLEAYNLQEARLIPDAQIADTDDRGFSSYSVQNAYYAYEQGRRLVANQVYSCTARAAADPGSQHASQLIFAAETGEAALESFVITDEIRERLDIFRAEPGLDGIDERMEDVAAELEKVTKIYQRRDVTQAILMTYCSPLFIQFNQSQHKGWMDILVLGDTGCGKSTVAKLLRQYFRLGEMVSVESASFAGIFGGLSSVGSRWSLQWGVIPLNDQRLVMLDETSGLSVEQIAQLSAMRSSGIAEIIKIENQRTFARTRLVWLCNPRSNRKIAEYEHGVLAVRELIGRPEDIRRFDLVVPVASDEVDQVRLNSQIMGRKPEPCRYTADAFNSLILWAWRRTASDIVFTPDAVDMILKESVDFCSRYTAIIPLIDPSEARIKLARLAASVATLTVSTPNGSTVVVEPRHVEWVCRFVHRMYAKPCFGYDTFSRVQSQAMSLRKVEELRKIIDADVARLLLDSDLLTSNDFEDIFVAGGERARLKGIINTLLVCNAIRRTERGYRKTAPFIAWLKDPQNAPRNSERMGDKPY